MAGDNLVTKTLMMLRERKPAEELGSLVNLFKCWKLFSDLLFIFGFIFCSSWRKSGEAKDFSGYVLG